MTIYRKGRGFTFVRIDHVDSYYTLFVNGEEVSSVHEDEPNAKQEMIEEAEGQLEQGE